MPQLGTWPATQARALRGIEPVTLCRPALNPLRHTSQGCLDFFNSFMALQPSPLHWLSLLLKCQACHSCSKKLPCLLLSTKSNLDAQACVLTPPVSISRPCVVLRHVKLLTSPSSGPVLFFFFFLVASCLLHITLVLSEMPSSPPQIGYSAKSWLI